MDEDGVAHFSAIENLASRARVSVEDTRKALEVFMAPDQNSANPENEGRRLERIPGGYLILNAAYHRNLMNRTVQREQNRERVTKFREKERLIALQGKCDCCGKDFELPYSKYVVLDHNHQTGLMRAFICMSCNTVVGRVELGRNTISAKKDLAIKYIEKHGPGNGEHITGALPTITPVSVSVSEYTSEFESFWNIYPRRKAKGQAYRAWQKLNPDSALQAAFSIALDAQAAERAALSKAGAFVPDLKYPGTWLNGKCWLDEPIDLSSLPKPKPQFTFKTSSIEIMAACQERRIDTVGKTREELLRKLNAA